MTAGAAFHHDLPTPETVRPDAALAAVARLLRPGGWLVVYTVDRWAPTTLANRLLPLSLRQLVMRAYGGEATDHFATCYRLNRRLLEACGVPHPESCLLAVFRLTAARLGSGSASG